MNNWQNREGLRGTKASRRFCPVGPLTRSYHRIGSSITVFIVWVVYIFWTTGGASCARCVPDKTKRVRAFPMDGSWSLSSVRVGMRQCFGWYSYSIRLLYRFDSLWNLESLSKFAIRNETHLNTVSQHFAIAGKMFVVRMDTVDLPCGSIQDTCRANRCCMGDGQNSGLPLPLMSGETESRM